MDPEMAGLLDFKVEVFLLLLALLLLLPLLLLNLTKTVDKLYNVQPTHHLSTLNYFPLRDLQLVI